MVMDVLTISSFVALILYKVVVNISSMFGGEIDLLRYKNSHNKAFKSDSQRLAVSLRSSIAKRRSHLNAALVARCKHQYPHIYLGGYNE
ncbi:hypothetical protein ACSTD8_21810 [Vibrio vulnificus]|uniref:hypothetical protein n=1 Tax=Vibrio vulnificus TaxID=672 RepID=UPI003EDABE5C